MLGSLTKMEFKNQFFVLVAAFEVLKRALKFIVQKNATFTSKMPHFISSTYGASLGHCQPLGSSIQLPNEIK